MKCVRKKILAMDPGCILYFATAHIAINAGRKVTKGDLPKEGPFAPPHVVKDVRKTLGRPWHCVGNAAWCEAEARN